MRTALRTAVATALLAGLATGPVVLATGTAFAADQPVAGTEATRHQGTLVRTETLADGSVAKIYRLGPTRYQAESFAHGASIGTIEANGRPAAGNNNGAFLVLFEDGRTLFWTGNYIVGVQPGRYRLADGTTLELGKNPKDGRLGLQLIENGKGRGFTYEYHPVRSVYTFGKAVVVLENGGGLAAYITGSGKQAAPVRVETPKPGPTRPAPTTGPVVTLGECTVRQDIPSVFGLMTVRLTNDLTKGPKAELKDEQGKAVAVVERDHPEDTRVGLRIKDANTATPKLGQRTQGGDTPYRWTAFPKLPKGCEKDGVTPTPAPSASTGNGTGSGTGSGTGTGTGTHGGQTTVVPRGGVAAGAEIAQGNDQALLVSAAGAAAVVAAGLGYTALRRRAAARG